MTRCAGIPPSNDDGPACNSLMTSAEHVVRMCSLCDRLPGWIGAGVIGLASLRAFRGSR